jgi:hypothetical protein
MVGTKLTRWSMKNNYNGNSYVLIELTCICKHVKDTFTYGRVAGILPMNLQKKIYIVLSLSLSLLAEWVIKYKTHVVTRLAIKNNFDVFDYNSDQFLIANAGGTMLVSNSSRLSEHPRDFCDKH